MNEAISIEIDLAQVIGLLALLVTLLVWRARNTFEITKLARANYRLFRTGFLAGKSLRGFTLHGIQLLLQGFAFLVCFYVAYVTFDYFERIENLFDPRIALDMGIHNRTWRLAEDLKDEIIYWIFIADASFISDWVFGWVATLMRDRKIEVMLQETASVPFHVYSFSPSGKSMPAAMWQDRIESIERTGEEYGTDRIDVETILEEDQWRREWPTWSRCVLLYHDFVSKEISRLSMYK